MEGEEVLGGGRSSREETDSEACRLAADSEAESCSNTARKEQEAEIPAMDMDVITRMPDLVQDKIFGFLSVPDKVQAAQVCPSWREAVYRPCQWKKVKVQLKSNRLSEETLSSWRERKIRHVEVCGFPAESRTLRVLHDWPGLASVVMDQHAVPLDVLERVFCQDFASLKELHASVTCRKWPVSPSFRGVFQHLPNLEKLSLCVDEYGDLDEAIPRSLTGLKHLSLTLSVLSGNGKGYNLGSLSQLGSLQSLVIHCMPPSGVDSLELSCKTLKKVTLQGCDLGTSEWPKVLSQMSCVEELDVANCKPKVEDGLLTLSQGLPKLKVLKCDRSCGWPLDHNDACRPCGPMSSLQTLQLRAYDFSTGVMRALSSCLKSLSSLTIHCPVGLDAESMKYIAEMSSLLEFSLADSDVDGSALKILSEGSCQLRKLSWRCCWETEGEDMRHVARMSSLCELTLSDLNLGSTGLRHLRQGSFRLEVLDVTRCGFTLQDVKLLLEKQQSLSRLSVVGCVKRRGEEIEVESLRQRYPSLRYCVIR